MADETYFRQITSVNSFNKSPRPPGEPKPFSQLGIVEASSWGREHLFACRVLVHTKRFDTLPMLDGYVATGEELEDRIKEPKDKLKKFLDGPNEAHKRWTAHALVREYPEYLGVIWAALSEFRHQPVPPTSPRPPIGPRNAVTPGVSSGAADGYISNRGTKRKRSTVQREGFVSSADIGYGSDSSDSLQRQSPTNSQTSDIYLVSNPAAPSEDVTVHLISSVIRYITFFAYPQHQSPMNPIVEFRTHRVRYQVMTKGGTQLTAINDGGLQVKERGLAGDFDKRRDTAVLLECKRRFKLTDEGRPTLSDGDFAQMTCEALAARLSGQEDFDDDYVVLIQATQTFVRFLQFYLPRSYLDNFEPDALPTSPDASPDLPPFLEVVSTRLFDLRDKNGRAGVAANMCGIMTRIHERHETD